MTRTVSAVDAFCGAGGTSTGLALACRDLGADLDLLAINHWKVAVETHSKNHPWARHLCSRVESVRPRDAFPEGKLNLLVASPECTHHSTARGGRPVSDQLRASAWHLIPWLEELTVDAMLVENVPEFVSWCRVGSSGRPVKKEKGAYFREWVRAVRTHGYNVDWRIVNSADFGDATSRRRLFVTARRGNRPIVWPRPIY
ncbi:C-5 cytosine-specific DNA methylase, partial [mine drainage metagenome]